MIFIHSMAHKIFKIFQVTNLIFMMMVYVIFFLLLIDAIYVTLQLCFEESQDEILGMGTKLSGHNLMYRMFGQQK